MVLAKCVYPNEIMYINKYHIFGNLVAAHIFYTNTIILVKQNLDSLYVNKVIRCPPCIAP